jgi:hypothetical protein
MYIRKVKIDLIESLMTTELAYIAGLLDGEGSLFIQSMGRRRGKEYLCPAIRVAMTHEGVVTWLANKLGIARATRLPPRNSDRFIHGSLPAYEVTLSGKRAQRLARAVLPYLLVKVKQAEIISSFPILLQGTPTDMETRLVRIALRERMIDANGRRKRNLNAIIPIPD